MFLSKQIILSLNAPTAPRYSIRLTDTFKHFRKPSFLSINYVIYCRNNTFTEPENMYESKNVGTYEKYKYMKNKVP